MQGFNTEYGFCEIGSITEDKIPISIGTDLYSFLDFKAIADGEWFINCDNDKRIRILKTSLSDRAFNVFFYFQTFVYPNWTVQAGLSVSQEYVGTQLGGIRIFQIPATDRYMMVYETSPVIGVQTPFATEFPGFNDWVELINPEGDEDPFGPGGISNIGGGGGNFSEASDRIEDELLPVLGAVGTGFATIFAPSAGQLRELSRLFWNADIFAFLQNMVENINSMFTSLGVLPFNVPGGGTVSVTWLGIDTTVSLTLAQKQYFEFDMGSINLANDERIFTSNSALDYSPFSKLGIYLPFIGFRDLDIDECRNCVMGLKYKIDILTGTCVAIISLNGNNIYQFSGNCLSQIPITNENMASLISNVTNVAIAGANAYNAATAAQAGLEELGPDASANDTAKAHMSIAHSENKLASSTANAVLSGKPTFEKTGSVSATAALMSIKQPYLFLTTPRQSLPSNYNRYKGYPCNITSTLGELSGFTVVDDIRLNGLVATSPEVSEIYEILKKGVII